MAEAKRVALVTGGSRGIGLACARALAAAGHDVAVSARDAERGAAAVSMIEDLGVRGAAIAMDVRDRESIEAGVAEVRAILGAPLVLVNNAGVAGSAPFQRIRADEWDDTLAVNVTGAFWTMRACLRAMLDEGWGRIVNVASVAALQGVAYAAHYAASKHALLGLTRSLALEVAPQGVTVNAVCPGFVDTEMTERTIERICTVTRRTPAEARREIERQSPQNRLMTPEEIAAAVVYLASDAAKGVNGHALALNG